MSRTLQRLTAGTASVSPANVGISYQTDLAGTERLRVSEFIGPDNLRRLLECLGQEDCVHSWRNFGLKGTLDGLVQWENNHRPTKLFFFYLEYGSQSRMVAAGAVADRLTRNFPHAGFCVLGRCYIMPEFRGQGFYRQILHYRLEYCRAQLGDALNGIHIGSVDDRVCRVLTNHRLPGWSRFIHLGEEELNVAGEVRAVGDYILLTPEYVSRIRAVLAGADAPSCVVELRNVLSVLEFEDVRNLGMLVRDTFEEGREWFEKNRSDEIEQLLLFCKSIPLIGF